MGHFVSGAEGKTAVFLQIWRKLRPEMHLSGLTEEEYQELQKLGAFDTKTSSWVKTPADIRKLGGALYCDRRYGRVFVGHNGAQSYYSARAFRGSLMV